MLSPRSKIKPASLGKIPCRWTPSGWSGFPNWQNFKATDSDIRHWMEWCSRVGVVNICAKGDEHPALDIDVDDHQLALVLHELIQRVAPGPVRRVRASDGSDGARFLVLYQGKPLPSWTTSFDWKGARYMIELKGARRQCVVEGLHKSGGRYAWSSPHPVEVGAGNLHRLSSTHSEALRVQLEDAIREGGGTNLVRDIGEHVLRGGAGIGRWKGEAGPSIEAVRDALRAAPNSDEVSREEWVKVAHHVKGACQNFLAEGLEAFLDWSEGYEGNTPDATTDLWEGIRGSQTGWRELAAWAYRASAGRFNSAVYDFDVPGEARSADALEEFFRTNLWVERQEAVYDMVERRLRTRIQFDAHAAYLGPIWVKEKTTPWAYFLREPDRVSATSPVARRVTVVDITYRPGEPRICQVGSDKFINAWHGPNGIPDEPVSDADVEPWLAHLALILPDEEERRNLLGWMASVVQRPAEKPNHGVVIGGVHGIGKSTLIRPLKAALGYVNVTEMNVRALDDNFSDWLGKTKLFVVEEMMNFGKRDMMQRLKTLLAAPPEFLTVNPKYGKRYEVPNILAGVFFTNHEDAIAVEKGERRFMIFWSPAKRQNEAYYIRFMAWMNNGGDLKAARWLLDYDASDYNMLGNAPETRGLEDMRRASRSKLDEWIEDGVEFVSGPFAPDLVALDDLRKNIPEDVLGRFGRPSAGALGSALKRAGAISVARIRLGVPRGGASAPMCDPNQARIFSVRRHEMYAGLANAKLAELYWQQRGNHERRDPFTAVPDGDTVEVGQ